MRIFESRGELVRRSSVLPWPVAEALELPAGLEEGWMLKVPGWGSEAGRQPACGAFSVGTIGQPGQHWNFSYPIPQP